VSGLLALKSTEILSGALCHPAVCSKAASCSEAALLALCSLRLVLLQFHRALLPSNSSCSMSSCSPCDGDGGASYGDGDVWRDGSFRRILRRLRPQAFRSSPRAASRMRLPAEARSSSKERNSKTPHPWSPNWLRLPLIRAHSGRPAYCSYCCRPCSEPGFALGRSIGPAQARPAKRRTKERPSSRRPVEYV